MSLTNDELPWFDRAGLTPVHRAGRIILDQRLGRGHRGRIRLVYYFNMCGAGRGFLKRLVCAER